MTEEADKFKDYSDAHSLLYDIRRIMVTGEGSQILNRAMYWIRRASEEGPLPECGECKYVLGHAEHCNSFHPNVYTPEIKQQLKEKSLCVEIGPYFWQ